MEGPIGEQHTMSHYVHHLPGRLRVKTSIIKRNEKEAARLRDLLTRLDGVRAHEVNLVTGSILITYDTDATDVQTILTFLKNHGYIEGITVLDRHSDLVSKVSSKVGSKMGSSMGKAFSEAVFGFVVEKALERSAVALIGAIL